MKSANQKQTVTGTAIYSRGELIIAQVPIYENDKAGDCYFRAKEHLEMLDRDMLVYLPHSTVQCKWIGDAQF